MKMYEADSPNQSIFIKYNKEENMKALDRMKDEVKIVEITTIKERKIDVMDGVGEKQYRESPKNMQGNNYRNKMIFETKNELRSSVLLCKKFTKKTKQFIQKSRMPQKFNCKWWIIRS